MEWAEQEQIRQAIVTIHAAADYYAGLDILCRLVDWPSFRFEKLYPAEEMNAWIRRQSAGQAPPPAAPSGPVKKVRGWPKGKKRGPRKPSAAIAASTCQTEESPDAPPTFR
jgi:hypothetical protein